MLLHPELRSQQSTLRTYNALIEAQCHHEIMLRLMSVLGGLLPGLAETRQTGLHPVHQVLMFGCGAGPWTLEMARTHPHSTIVGIDRSQQMVRAANRQVQVQQLRNVWHLRVAQGAGPISFPAASFDLLTAHFLSRWLTCSEWPLFLRECLRLLRPGGTLYLLEYDAASSNAPAHAALWHLLVQARRLTQRSFSPSDYQLGVQDALPSLLAEMGFCQPQRTLHTLSYASDAPLHEEWTKDLCLLAAGIQPRLVAHGLTTPQHSEQLLRQQQVEMSLPTFRATLPILTIWATKPEAV